jgi:uncharacterized protein YbaR (Trm112 family)
VQLVCPKCGGDEITSWETSSIGYKGVKFFQNPEPDDPNYGPIIIDYDGVFDDSIGDGGDFENDLACRGCGVMVRQEDLVPDGTEPSPDWARPTGQLACPRCKSSDNLGTVETMRAVAFIGAVRRDDDGKVHVDYAGESDVLWDTQTWDGKQLVCRGCGIDIAVEDLAAEGAEQ